MTKLPILTGLAVAATVAMSLPASALPTVVINSVTGFWGPLTGGSSVNTENQNSKTPKVSWGTPIPSTGGQSSYLFEGIAPPATDGIDADTEFLLGSFTHFNNPIASGTSITKAVLTLTFDATFTNTLGDETALTDFMTTYEFGHFETPNGANPCADGGAQGVGINDAGCADRVTALTNTGASDSFTDITGVTYFLGISGFQQEGVDFTQFWTREGAPNTADIYGIFTATPPSTIPLPAPFMLLLGGMAGLGFVSRKRKAA